MTAGRPKVRADAQALAAEAHRLGLSLSDVEPDEDGWITGDGIIMAMSNAGLVLPRGWRAGRPMVMVRPGQTPSGPARRPSVPGGPWGDGDPVAWAVSTGRITARDVGEWRAKLAQDRAGTEATLQILAASEWHAQNQGVVGRVPAVAASPARPGVYANAVEELRAKHPGSVARAEAAEPAPTVFAEGNNPAATASGIDPAALRGLPWRARLAAAWTADRSKAFAITQTYGGPDGDWLALNELGNDPAVVRYVGEVQTWYATAGTFDPDNPDSYDPLTAKEVAALFGPTAIPFGSEDGE